MMLDMRSGVVREKTVSELSVRGQSEREHHHKGVSGEGSPLSLTEWRNELQMSVEADKFSQEAGEAP